MKSTLDKHYRWWVHLLGIMEVRCSTSWTAVCKNDQIANMLLASEDWGPGHGQRFFLLAKFLHETKFKIQKWTDSEGFFIFKNEGKNSKNYQIFIIGFQCAVEKDLEGWLKFCTSYMIYSQILAKSSWGWSPLFLHLPMHYRHFGLKQKNS
jgi:hypothetical protein